MFSFQTSNVQIDGLHGKQYAHKLISCENIIILFECNNVSILLFMKISELTKLMSVFYASVLVNDEKFRHNIVEVL